MIHRIGIEQKMINGKLFTLRWETKSNKEADKIVKRLELRNCYDIEVIKTNKISLRGKEKKTFFKKKPKKVYKIFVRKKDLNNS